MRDADVGGPQDLWLSRRLVSKMLRKNFVGFADEGNPPVVQLILLALKNAPIKAKANETF